MTSRTAILAHTAVLTLAAVAYVDVHEEYAFLSQGAAWIAWFAAVGAFVFVLRSRELSYHRASLFVLIGVLWAMSCRTFGYGTILRYSAEDWRALQETEARETATHVAERFATLTSEAERTALELARSSALAVAAEGSDAEDYIAGAFDALSRADLPRAHPRAVPGATLYDLSGRPLAWTGDNVSLPSSKHEPERSTFILERGVYTYLVATEPLASRLGQVSVEVPLAADRRLENRYLEDYDAVSSWVGPTVDTDYLSWSERTEGLSELFAARGEPFWGGTEEAPRLFFGLRSAGEALLGVSSVAGETPIIARLEARRRTKLAASFGLVLATLVGLGLLARDRRSRWTALLAIWASRLVLLFTDFPLGLGLDLDNPAYYATSLFFGLARSPIDFFLTMAALLGTSLLLANRFHLWEKLLGDREAPVTLPFRVAATVGALSLFVGASYVVRDAWLNSTLSLSTISATTFDAPRLVVQLSLLGLFVSTALLAILSLALAERGRGFTRRAILRGAAIDGAIVLAALALTSSSELAAHVRLSVLPLAATHLFVVARGRLWSPKTPSVLDPRLRSTLFVLLLAVFAHYPSLAWFEESTVRNFIETTVTPVVLQHGKSRMYALGETASAIDRMLSEGRLDELEREDLAYRIWVSTDLAVSSLSSSVTIVDGGGATVSRFALSFPTGDFDTMGEPAPEEWIVEEETLPGNPEHPGILLARRSLPGPDGLPWEIRIRLTADWRNLPFITTLNPYLYLFRTPGVDSPLRFPYRELELFVLEMDGTAVFQSAGGLLQLGDEPLRAAREAPFWQEHRHEDEIHRSYFFSDGTYVYALSFPVKPPVRYAAELAGWALLAAVVALVVVSLRVVLSLFGSRVGIAPRVLWAGLGRSFYGKLYVAFVLIALVPIVCLAFLIRGIVIRQLQTDVELEGMARAEVVERFVNDLMVYQRRDLGHRATVDDAVLEWVGSLAAVDVDLYSRGELVATSKPELFGSGLLRTRAVAHAHRDIVLSRRSSSIHRESVGSFRYLVVSVPIMLETWREPSILSLPLASREPEIARKVASLNQTVLLAALGFSLAAMALAHSLARRIAGPINTLTAATHRVAQGDLDVSVQTSSRDEIGALFAGFAQMTSDLKRQRSDLERTKKLEAWAEMARQVAHEVKNPLTPIQLATEHLLRVKDDPNVDFERVLAECSETILQQVKTLRHISMEFSTFASPEPLKLERTDVEELVRETVEPYLQTAPNGVRVDVTIPGPIPPLEADGRLLKRTLVNLVENALHAINGEGRVHVEVAPERVNGGRFVRVSVSDTGVGVDAETRARIFEPYFSTRAAGTGLGLAIAKKVVEDHGGTITLESEPTRGTVVTLRLPVTSS